TRVAEWIPTESVDQPPSSGLYDRPLTPRLWTMWEDEEGLLWLGMVVPSSAWEPGPPRDGLGDVSDETHAVLAARPRAEVIVEVVDLARQEVVVRSRFPGTVGTQIGGGYFALAVEDSTGNPSLQIRRARLVR